LGYILRRTGFLSSLQREGEKKCKAMHVSAFLRLEKEGLSRRVEFFIFTYFILVEQLHSEARLGSFSFFSFFPEELYTRGEGEQKKSFCSNVLLLDGATKFLFLHFIFFFGHWEFSYVWVCFQSLDIFRIKRFSSYSHRYINMYK
jgi:hypothetical protein